MRRAPLLLHLIAAGCFAWSLPALLRWRSFEELGAVTRAAFFDGEYWRILPSAALHGGWLHLAFNLLSLYAIAIPAMQAAGRGRAAAVLLLSAASGFAASLVFTSPAELHVPRVGISGGVLGLVGLLLAFEVSLSRSVRGFFLRRNVVVLLTVLAFNFVLGRLVPNVDEAAHHGGLLAGFLLSLPLCLRIRYRRVPLLAAAALLTVLLPLAYAAHPFADPVYREYRESREFLAACRALRTDRSVLRTLRAPRTNREADALREGLEELAETLLPRDPAACDEMLTEADRLGAPRFRVPHLWHRLAVDWRGAGRPAEARRAFHRATLGLPLAAAAEPAMEAVRLAAGLVEEPDAGAWIGELLDDLRFARGRLPEEESTVAAVAAALGRRLQSQAAPGGPGADPSHARGLARVYEGLAAMTEDDAAGGRYLYESARWEWKGRGEGEGAGERGEAALLRMEVALRRATAVGDAATEERARAWLADPSTR